jgi:hypothetical protein
MLLNIAASLAHRTIRVRAIPKKRHGSAFALKDSSNSGARRRFGSFNNHESLRAFITVQPDMHKNG